MPFVIQKSTASLASIRTIISLKSKEARVQDVLVLQWYELGWHSALQSMHIHTVMD